MLLKAVGFWYSDYEPHFPRPQHLVRPGIFGKQHALITGYLRSGAEYEVYRGYSYCRFRCGIEDCRMGHGELTDGEWVWPEGLVHYIEEHSVCLPDEFIATMRDSNWRVPQDVRFDYETDQSFWID